MLIYNNKTWFHQSERWGGDTNIFFIECDTGKKFIQIALSPQYLFLVVEKK